MADIQPYTPHLLGLVALWLAWLSRSSIQNRVDVAKIQTTLENYFDTNGKVAAKLLNRKNPTPEHIQPLLKKYERRMPMSQEERRTLKDWLRSLLDDTNCPKDEQGLAMQLLSGMEAMKELASIKSPWWARIWN